ncbi:MAG: hypothetical protein P1U36_00365 [Legionellaceae bacterium]|nr:hypothetical protein [Legionellaceae bacterium]
MKKTSLALATLVASLSLAFVVPASHAGSKPAVKASCHHDKPCSCAQKCPHKHQHHKDHKCNKTSEAKAHHDVKK